MTGLADIAVRIGADISGLTSGLNTAGSQVDGFRSKMNSSASVVMTFGAATIAAGAALSVHMVAGAMEAIGAQDDLARKMGTTVSSMATLTRAGELNGVSLQTITGASTKLTMAMGKAADTSSTQAAAFDRLGLKTSELAAMPLDQRIAAVNEAISQNIPKIEQASVAAELFGSKAALAMAALDSAAMAEAQHQTELFGLALSDVDSAKVEMAGDAMSVFGSAADGFTQQATVKLAPILSAISDLFLKNAEQAGGMGNIVTDVFDNIVEAITFAMNALDGFKRVGEIVFGTLTGGLAAVLSSAIYLTEGLLNTIDLIPGVDMSAVLKQVEGFRASLDGVVETQIKNMNDALNEPLAGDKFKQFVADAQKAGEAGAAAAVATRKAAAESSGQGAAPLEQKEDPEVKKAREKAARLAEIEAERAAKKAEAALAQSQADLNNLQNSYLSEVQLLDVKYTEEQAIIDKALANKQISQENADAMQQQATQAHQDAINKIEKDASDKRKAQTLAEQRAKVQGITNGLNAVSGLIQGSNKKQFEQKKKLGIAAALVNMYQGVSEGVALGWPMAIPAVAYAIATGLGAINSIRAQTMNGGGSGGGGGGAVGAGAAIGAPNNANQSQPANNNLFVRGINKNDLFSGQQLVDIINQAMQSGAVLRLN